jgi:pyrimidine-specific ribonucleoside hydrolase
MINEINEYIKMNKKQVWIDTDLSVGMKRHEREGYCDVDDGYAVLQLLNAPQVEIVGIGTVFGNTTIENAYDLGQMMSARFAAQEIPVYKGAGKAIDLKQVVTNDAVEALAEALKRQPLIIMAIGPATNIGLLLLLYPELKSQILEVVLVAGRRKPTDYFKIGNKGNHARDLNFDLDNDAFRILFECQVPVVLCPFEISNKVWLTQTDLETLRNGRPGNEWLAKASEAWLQQWVDQGAPGFNPFDVLASHYIIAPEDLISEPLQARLEIHPDDTVKENTKQSFKHYLLCSKEQGFPVTYCYDVVDGYHNKLIASLTR